MFIFFASRVHNHTEVEAALHTAFGPDRINPRREFFKLDPGQVIALLKLLDLDDVTDEVQADAENYSGPQKLDRQLSSESPGK